MAKISFVMPTKNRGSIIVKAIQSIIDQTEKDWELIVVDDHSDKSDETKEAVSGFADERIKYYRISDTWSGGIAEARNFGNQLASSPIIAVADSDDLAKPNRAQLTVDAFKRDNCDVFYGDVEIYDETTGEVRFRSDKYPVVDFSLEKMKEYDLIPHGASAYKTELAYEFPYNSFFKLAEDYDLFTRLAKAGKKFYYCDQIVYRYIVHGGNISTSHIPGNFGKLIKLNRGWDESQRGEIIDKILSV